MSTMSELAAAIPDARSKFDMHLAGMAMLEELLERLIMQATSDPAMLCISDGEVPTVLSKDFPYEGATRAMVRRTPDGPNVVATGGLLFAANVNRIGGHVTNKSAAAGATLFLSDQLRAGAGTVWLAPNGGSWDFRLGNVLWCGNVFAVPDSGNLSLAGAEV